MDNNYTYVKGRAVETLPKISIKIAKYSPNGYYLALLTTDLIITIMIANTYEVVLRINLTNRRNVNDMDFARHNSLIGMATDNVLEFHGVPRGTPVKIIAPVRVYHHFTHLKFAHDNVVMAALENYFIYIYYDCMLSSLDRYGFVKLHPYNAEITSISFITFSSLITGYDDGVCIKWDSTHDDRTIKEEFPIQPNIRNYRILHTTVSPENDYVLLTHKCSKLTSWRIEDTVARAADNLPTVIFHKLYSGHTSNTSNQFAMKALFMFHDQNKFVIAGSKDSSIYIWNFETAEVVKVLSCNQSTIPVSIVLYPTDVFKQFGVLQENGEFFIWKKQIRGG